MKMRFLYILPIFIMASSGLDFNPFGGILNAAQNTLSGAAEIAQGRLGSFGNWAEFLATTGKSYASKAEEQLREGIFSQHKKLVETYENNFKSGLSSFTLGLNPFSDLRPSEIVKKLTGLKKSTAGSIETNKFVQEANITAGSLPDNFDWRQKGGVTPIKFQGLECGACWSFAVTGAIEGHVFRKTGNLIPLSEQNLVDCAEEFGNQGCDGGFQEYGFAYVAHNKGISKAQVYPYIEKQGQCKYAASDRGATIKGFGVIQPGNEEKLRSVVATLGPVAASVNAAPETFQLYKSGIYNDKECNKEEVNHSVLIVGYGVENGQKFWIIKNSWTEKWGENGFMRLARNENNLCGIADEASYPIL